MRGNSNADEQLRAIWSAPHPGWADALAPLADECRYCGCTELEPCATSDDIGEFCCSWFKQPDHSGLGVCSAPVCVQAYLADATAP